MKIKIEHYDKKYTFETKNDDLGLEELHEIWEKCLLSMTWTQEQIDKYYNI